MARQKNLSIKRFGPRYGRNVKQRFAKIEADQRKSYSCPYCHAERVRRQAVGIWACTKCNAKFTGRAYSVQKKKSVSVAIPKTETIDVVEEEPVLTQSEEEDVKISRQPDEVGVVSDKPKPKVEEQPLDIPMDLEVQ